MYKKGHSNLKLERPCSVYVSQYTSTCFKTQVLFLKKFFAGLLFTPVSITPLIGTEDACFGLNASRPIAKGDLKWRDALLVAHRVNSNVKKEG